MYSMVLMAALATSPDAASFGRGGGCYGGCTGTVVSVGCGGCTGTVVPVGGGCCSGSCFGSCFGSSCTGSGCCGGHVLFPRLRSLFSFHGGCCGGWSCHSSCCGGSCFSESCFGGSCYSSCLGSSCTGMASCFGSCTGMADFGGGGFDTVNPINPTTACYGSPIFNNRTGTLSGPTVYGWPVYSPTSFGYGSCFGSGPVYYGPDFYQGSSFVTPPVHGSGIIKDGLGRTAPAVPTITIDNTKEFRAAEAKPNAAPARLTVELPAAAKLYVDGALVSGDAATRNFHTPDLPPGKTFYYDLKAEVSVGGKTVTEEKRVLVRAGDTLNESFPKVIAAAKSDKADAVAKK